MNSETVKFKTRRNSRAVCRRCPALASILLKTEHGYTLADTFNWRKGYAPRPCVTL